MELVDVESLNDDALVAPCGWIGAPTVSAEKLPSGEEGLLGLRRLEKLLGRRVEAVFPIEIGGSNGLAPMLLALRAGLPVVDCDGMGRAIPESQMVIFKYPWPEGCPAVLTDDKGNCFVIEAVDNLSEERIARAVIRRAGRSCHLMEYPLSGSQAKAAALRGTMSDALAIGRSIRLGRESGRDPFVSLFAALKSSRHPVGECQRAGSMARSSTSSGRPTEASRSATRHDARAVGTRLEEVDFKKE